MAKANVGSILVVDQDVDWENNREASKVVGILSERDYLKKIAVQGRSSHSTHVAEIMTGRSRMITAK